MGILRGFSNIPWHKLDSCNNLREVPEYISNHKKNGKILVININKNLLENKK